MFVVPGDRRPQSHFYPFAHRASGGKAEEIQFQPSEGHDARTIELRPLAGILHDAFRAILIGERIHNWVLTWVHDTHFGPSLVEAPSDTLIPPILTSDFRHVQCDIRHSATKIQTQTFDMLHLI